MGVLLDVVTMVPVSTMRGGSTVTAMPATLDWGEIATVCNTSTPLVSVLYNISFTDINECAIGFDNCGDNAVCDNIVGSFTCECEQGYLENGTICEGDVM